MRLCEIASKKDMDPAFFPSVASVNSRCRRQSFVFDPQRRYSADAFMSFVVALSGYVSAETKLEEAGDCGSSKSRRSERDFRKCCIKLR